MSWAFLVQYEHVSVNKINPTEIAKLQYTIRGYFFFDICFQLQYNILRKFVQIRVCNIDSSYTQFRNILLKKNTRIENNTANAYTLHHIFNLWAIELSPGFHENDLSPFTIQRLFTTTESDRKKLNLTNHHTN